MSSITAPGIRRVEETLIDNNGRRVEIEIRLDDLFVNATRICSSYDKRWSDFASQPSHIRFFTQLERALALRRDQLIHSQRGGTNPGTWVDRRIAVRLLAWCNEEFEVAAAELLTRYLTGNVTTEDSRNASRALSANVVVPAGLPSEREQYRIDVIHANTVQCDSIKNFIVDKRPDDRRSAAIYPRLNDAINYAVFDLPCTTSAFKKRRGIPQRMSLAMVASGRALLRMTFLKYALEEMISKDREKLGGLSDAEFEMWVAQTRKHLHAIGRSLGFHTDIELHILPTSDALEAEKALKAKRKAAHIAPSPHIAMLAQ